MAARQARRLLEYECQLYKGGGGKSPPLADRPHPIQTFFLLKARKKTYTPSMNKDLYKQKIADAAYNAVDDVFFQTGSLTEQEVPLEFVALARESLKKYFSSEGSEPFVELQDVMPNPEAMPDVMLNMAGRMSGDGGYEIFDKFEMLPEEDRGDLLNIFIKIPAEDRRVGNIPDLPFNFSEARPSLPNAILSDERMDMMEEAIAGVMGNV